MAIDDNEQKLAKMVVRNETRFGQVWPAHLGGLIGGLRKEIIRS